MKQSHWKIVFIIYAILVWTVSSIPNLSAPPFTDNAISADKIAHIIQYFIFAFLYFKFRQSIGIERGDILLELFFLGGLISVFDELHQKYIPGREFSWWDTVANILGFYTFIFIVHCRCVQAQKEQN